MGWSEPYWPMMSGPLMMIIIFVIICVGVILIVRIIIYRFCDKSPAILKEPFAPGEISQTEYEKRKRILKP